MLRVDMAPAGFISMTGSKMDESGFVCSINPILFLRGSRKLTALQLQQSTPRNKSFITRKLQGPHFQNNIN